MDDIIIVGNNNLLLPLNSFLRSKHSIKGPYPLHYFFDIQVIQFYGRLFISRSKHTFDIIEKCFNDASNVIYTPLAFNCCLNARSFYLFFVGQLLIAVLLAPFNA